MEARRSPARLPLLASVSVGLLGAVLLAVYMREFERRAAGGAPVALVATRRDVSAGEPLSETMLITHVVPESYVEQRQVLAADLSKVLGVRAAIDLAANQTLAWTDLVSTPRHLASLSARVPPGMRAVSIEHAGRRTFGELLRPGDRVDVLLTRSQPNTDSRLVTVPLLQNLLILAVGDSIRATHLEGSPTRPDSVTVLVTIEQASLLAQARHGGEITLALRNESDLEIAEDLPETDDSDIFQLEKRADRQRRVLIERVD